MSEKISQSETTTPRARRTRVKKINASYTRVYGSHSAFDLIELLPARTIGNISSIARQDVDRELTTDYLRETLHQSLGVQLQEGLAIEIRMRCRAGIEEIVRANIHETRRGTSQDNRLGSLKTSLVRLEQALMGLTKAEIDIVTAAIDRTYDEITKRRIFIILNSIAEFMYVKEMLKEPLPPVRTEDEAFNKEAVQQHQHPSEFWVETLLRLTVAIQEWMEIATREPTSRSRAGRPKNYALKKLSKQLYSIYKEMDHDKESHLRFRKFLDVVLGPLIPEAHRPKGGFKSLATTTRQGPNVSASKN